jgi:hypothetical protein
MAAFRLACTTTVSFNSTPKSIAILTKMGVLWMAANALEGRQHTRNYSGHSVKE